MESEEDKKPLLRNHIVGGESRQNSITPREITSEKSPKSRWIPLEVVIAVYFMSFMLTSPVMQFYIYGKIAEYYGVKDFQKDDGGGCSKTNHTGNDTTSLIQKEAADQFMYLAFVSSFPAIIPTLFLGSISDKYGRKVSMLITFSGLLIRQIIYVVVIVTKLPFEIFYLGNLIEGLTGYYGSALMAAFGMLADITKPGKERAFRITIMEGVIAVLVGLVMLGTGYWIKYAGFLSPMITATALSFVNILIIVFFIPETNKTKNYQGSICSIKNITRCFVFYYKDTADKRRKIMIICFAMIGLTVATVLGKSNIMTLFLLNRPLCWSVVHTQVLSAVGVAVNWGAGMLILGLIQKCVRDTGLITIGNMFATASFIVYGFADQDWLVYLGKFIVQYKV